MGIMSLEDSGKGRRIRDVAVFIEMVNDRLTDEEHRYLVWEGTDGRKYSFKEWMLKKYDGYRIDLTEEELSYEADKLLREFREGQ